MPSSIEMTIVIPVHNRAGIIGRTLKSVAAQSHRPLRVILVDNNSTDGTLQVLRQWKRDNETPRFVVDIFSEPSPGATAARNRGLKEVSSKYTMFFDSDDTMRPTHVSRAVEALNAASSPTIVGWDVNIIPLEGPGFSKPFYASDAMWHCIMHGSMGTQRYAAHTCLFREAGAWNPLVMGWNDIELGLRLLQLNPVIKKLPGITVDIFRQRDSITGTDFSSTPAKWEHALDVMESNLATNRHKRYIRLRRALLAGDYSREGAVSESHRLLRATLTSEPSPFHRAIYRIAHRYVALGGRGAARLLRPLF